MEILFLSFLCALSYIIILCKIFSLSFIARTQVFWDILFTLGVPFLFIGTFSGMSTAIITGVIFSMITFFLSLLVEDKPKTKWWHRLSYGKRRKKSSDRSNHPPRSRCA
jgi:hypothetical protein